MIRSSFSEAPLTYTFPRLNLELLPYIRIITLQLILQVLVVAGVAFYKSSSILYIVGSVILSVLIWCVLFYLYTGDVFFPIIALANLHWVVFLVLFCSNFTSILIVW